MMRSRADVVHALTCRLVEDLVGIDSKSAHGSELVHRCVEMLGAPQSDRDASILADSFLEWNVASAVRDVHEQLLPLMHTPAASLSALTGLSAAVQRDEEAKSVFNYKKTAEIPAGAGSYPVTPVSVPAPEKTARSSYASHIKENKDASNRPMSLLSGESTKESTVGFNSAGGGATVPVYDRAAAAAVAVERNAGTTPAPSSQASRDISKSKAQVNLTSSPLNQERGSRSSAAVASERSLMHGGARPPTTAGAVEAELVEELILSLQGLEGSRLHRVRSTEDAELVFRWLPSFETQIHPAQLHLASEILELAGLVCEVNQFTKAVLEPDSLQAALAPAANLSGLKPSPARGRLTGNVKQAKVSARRSLRAAAGGLVTQSLAAALSDELHDYQTALNLFVRAHLAPSNESAGSERAEGDEALLSASLLSPPAPRLPTLLALYAWCQAPMQQLRLLAQAVRISSPLDSEESAPRGGSLVAQLSEQAASTGSASAARFFGLCAERSAKPLFEMVRAWIFEGSLVDPFAEFFIAQRASPGNGLVSSLLSQAPLCLWRETYFVRGNMVPPFFNASLVSKILTIGKSINFLSKKCHDRSWMKLISALDAQVSVADLGDALVLNDVVDQLDSLLGQHLLDILQTKFHLGQHCNALHRFVLLGDGSFAYNLMSLLAPSLAREADSLYRQNLLGSLESALQASLLSTSSGSSSAAGVRSLTAAVHASSLFSIWPHAKTRQQSESTVSQFQPSKHLDIRLDLESAIADSDDDDDDAEVGKEGSAVATDKEKEPEVEHEENGNFDDNDEDSVDEDEEVNAEMGPRGERVVSGWQAFALDYCVEDPIGSVLTGPALAIYRSVFQWLWRIRRVGFELSATWASAARLASSLPSKSPALMAVRGGLRALHQMRQFVTGLQEHIVLQALVHGWKQLDASIAKSRSLDQFLRAHASYLNVVLERSLLKVEFHLIFEKLTDLLDICLRFADKLTALINAMRVDTAVNAASAAEHSFPVEKADQLHNLSARFGRRVHRLLKLLNAVARTLPHEEAERLSMLAFKLDFSEFYAKQVEESLIAEINAKNVSAAMFGE